MMSSNTTDYDTNWRFLLDYTSTTYVKILTEENLFVTNNNDDMVTLQRRITDDNNNPQNYLLCEDCPEDQ